MHFNIMVNYCKLLGNVFLLAFQKIKRNGVSLTFREEPIVLHPFSAFLSYRLSDVSITVQCECCGIMSGILLDRFYVISSPESIDDVSMA